MNKGPDDLMISYLSFPAGYLFGPPTEAGSYRTNPLHLSLLCVQTVFWALQFPRPKRIQEPFHTGDAECWIRTDVTALGVKDDFLSLILSFLVFLGSTVCL